MVYEFTRDQSQDRSGWRGHTVQGGVESGGKPPEGQLQRLSTSGYATDDARGQQLTEGESSNVKFPEVRV
jgi:hypothetical protein